MTPSCAPVLRNGEPQWCIQYMVKILLLALALLADTAQAQAVAIIPRRLENGLLVLVVHDSSAKETTINTAVFAGFRDEPDSLRGLAHLSQRMAMRETRSGSSLASAASASGIKTTAATRGDVTVFTSSAAGTSKALRSMLDLERLRLSDLLLAPAAIAAETQRTRAELGGRLEAQGRGNVLFGTHRLSRPVSYTGLTRIGLRDVHDFVERFYLPTNAAILIQSPIAALDVLIIAERAFAAMPAPPVLLRPVLRDTTHIVSTGRRGPVANAGGYGLAVTVPGLQDPLRPALERDLAELRARIVSEGPFTAQATVSDDAPASVLTIRVRTSASLDSVLLLLNGRPYSRAADLPPRANPDPLDCEAAGDWRYCVDIANARGAPSTGAPLNTLAMYLLGSRTPLPLWPSGMRVVDSVSTRAPRTTPD